MDHRESYEALLPEEEEAWLSESAAVQVLQRPEGSHEVPQLPKERHVAEIAAVEPDAVVAAIDQLERIEKIKEARASGIDCEEEDWGQEADALAVLDKLENPSPRKINELGNEELAEKQDQDGLISGIIIVGGLSVGSAEIVRQSTVVYRLTPMPAISSSFWSAYLPDGLYCGETFATCTAINMLYFSGGNETGDAFASYDPIHNVWSMLPRMPRGRRHHSIAAIGPWVFVIGGCNLNNENLDLIDAFNLSSQRWYEAWCTISPALQNVSSIALRNCVYIFGSAVDDSEGCCQVHVLEMVGTEPSCIRSGFQPLQLKAETVTPLANQSDVYLLDRQCGAIYNICAPREGDSILIRKMKHLLSKPHMVQGALLHKNELFTIGLDGVKEKLGHFLRRPLNFPPPFGLQAQLLSFPRSHFPVLSGQGVTAVSCKGFWVDRQMGWEPMDPVERALQEAMLLSLQDHPIQKRGGDNLEKRGIIDDWTIQDNPIQKEAHDNEEELGAVGGVPADSPIIQMGRNHFAMAALLASNEQLAVTSLRASTAGLGLSEAEEIVHTCKEKGLNISSLSEEDQTAVALLLSRMQQPAKLEENVDLDCSLDEDLDSLDINGQDDEDDKEGAMENMLTEIRAQGRLHCQGNQQSE